jgi:maleate isomerase
MTDFTYDLETNTGVTMGLVVLQMDQRIESDMRQMLTTDIDLHVTRIPSGTEVTSETLAQMEADLPMAVSLFPPAAQFDVVGYGCTSGTSVIGAPKIAKLIKSSCKTNNASEPVSALIAACRHLGLQRIGFLSPYVETVSNSLRKTLQDAGIETPVFGSFNESIEERVVQISTDSVFDAAVKLDTDAIDAIFLSCTNLNTLPVIKRLEQKIGKPVLSSNQVLAWHMTQLAKTGLSDACPGRLFESS